MRDVGAKLAITMSSVLFCALALWGRDYLFASIFGFFALGAVLLLLVEYISSGDRR